MTGRVSSFLLCLLVLPLLFLSPVSAVTRMGPGQLSAVPGVRLVVDNTALCFLAADAARGAMPILCAVSSKPLDIAVLQGVIQDFDRAGGRPPRLGLSDLVPLNLAMSALAIDSPCSVAQMDQICASSFANATAYRGRDGVWAFCGSSPEPIRAYTARDAVEGTCVTSARDIAVDECWTANPCTVPNECRDDDLYTPGTALCTDAGVQVGGNNETHSSIFNRCVTVLGTSVCVDVWAGDKDIDGEGACAFGAQVTRDEEVILSQQIDLGAAPVACAPISILDDDTCQACIELNGVQHYERDANGKASAARGCVEFFVECENTLIAQSQLGCVDSFALTQCEESLEKMDREFPPVDPGNDNTRCVRPTTISPPLCLDLESEGCDVVAHVRVGNRRVFSRAFDARDFVDVADSNDAIHTVLQPRTFCFSDTRLPCQTCIEWSPNRMHSPEMGQLAAWGGCATVNVTCLDEPVASNDLGCFSDTLLGPSCFEPCDDTVAETACGPHGRCQEGACACDALWHGAKCSYQCPGDCSGSARGVCLPTGECQCIPPATGTNCSTNLLSGLDLQPGATRRVGGNKNDDNYRGAPTVLSQCVGECNRRGDCVEGTCECYDGFGGVACEEETSGGLSGTSIVVILLMLVVCVMVVAVVVCAVRMMAKRESELMNDDLYRDVASTRLLDTNPSTE